MRKIALLSLILGAFALTTPVQAQAMRTWVSGAGDDANPCSRTAPCKTFAGALVRTATGGEIRVIDPAGFGAVTITKSITIDGSGIDGGVLLSGSKGIVVRSNVGRVVLRNLDIEGPTDGSGIRSSSNGELLIQRVRIQAPGGRGIDLNSWRSGKLIVASSIITHVKTGIRMRGGVAFLDRVSIQKASSAGIETVGRHTMAFLNDSTFSDVAGSAVAITRGAGIVNLVNTSLTDNASGLMVAAHASLIVRSRSASESNPITDARFVSASDNWRSLDQGGLTESSPTGDLFMQCGSHHGRMECFKSLVEFATWQSTPTRLEATQYEASRGCARKHKNDSAVRFDADFNPILGSAEFGSEYFSRVAYNFGSYDNSQKDPKGMVRFLSPLESGAAISLVPQPGGSADANRRLNALGGPNGVYIEPPKVKQK